MGEKVGTGEGPKVDIALDPLEGTTLTAKAMSNALAVVAMVTGRNASMRPDVYMDKIACWPWLSRRHHRSRRAG
ncbi:MAG: fructose-bisphosphatase class II [Parvularculaceae bacterium]